jgi:putative membrane protein
MEARRRESAMRGRSILILYLKGVAMGAADAVPGVSGGTVAFIAGIYETLVDAIRSFDGEAVRLLFRGRWAALWRHVNGGFLVVLFAGIGTAILLLSRLLLHLLDHEPEMLWSFFFGLILASVLAVSRKVERRDFPVLLSGLIGIGIGYGITVAVPAATPETLVFVFLSGAVAICAMILPGISGSFILVLLSKYRYVFGAIRDLNLPVILVFGAGCAVGLLSFSHLLHYTLRRHYAPTIALLTGLMVGSLNKVWPWKRVVESFVKPDGEIVPLVERNLSPFSYLEATGREPRLLAAVLLAAVGFGLVLWLSRMGEGSAQKFEEGSGQGR